MTIKSTPMLVILAAGMGTRMAGVLQGPKPLADIGGEPLLQRTLRQFHEIGVTKSCVVVGYEAKSVAAVAHGLYPEVDIIFNDAYSKDKNIYSLLLALNNLEDVTRVVVVEGDVVLSDAAVSQLQPLLYSNNSIWVGCGLFHEGQVGGILKADAEGRIQEIRYSSYTQELDDWFKNLGVLLIAPKHVQPFCNLLRQYAEHSLDCYFMTPWQEHLDMLPARLFDVGRDGGATFNTPHEYEMARRIVTPLRPYSGDICLLDVKSLRHIEAFDANRVTWLKDKIAAEGVWTVPLAVSKEHNLVMDGQHRLEVAILLGLRRVPSILFDYKDVPVHSLRSRYDVSVEEIVKRSLSGNIFPYKTAKHMLPNIPRCHIPLSKLQ